LVQYKNIDKIPAVEMECSGCSGFIRVQMGNKSRLPLKSIPDNDSEKNDLIAGLLSNFSIFESVDEFNIRAIVPILKIKRYPVGAIVLRKGAPAQNFYILLSGTVEVLDDGWTCLCRLSKSDVFGEMSLISGNPVGATVKVVEPASMVVIEGSDFKDIIHKFPSVQMYLARLLTKRLAASNVCRAAKNSSGMSGELSQMSATELLQALELSQKSGMLRLTLPKGPAQLFINNGNLIRADYVNKAGREAVFEILMEKEGRFSFHHGLPEDQTDDPKLGSLMEILLEASRMIDDNGGEDEAFA
jgi:CRP-like cAMP-binding protein